VVKKLKPIGVIREVDTQNRICIPAEYREALGINVDDTMLLSQTNGVITAEKVDLKFFGRKVDKCGRVTIPLRFRKDLDINPGDNVEIHAYGDGTITFEKYKK
jgi:AbrB family looped-hinge helix DNA binding protein